MKNLILKEFKLALHPTMVIFLALSAMMMIPNYPYYVTFFYTGLGVFFTCLNGRENNDVFFSVNLPVKKRDIVKARFALVMIFQLLQIFTAAIFAVLRQLVGLSENLAGMDANIAFFGFAFVLLGLFNVVFFGIYYRNIQSVGKAFLVSGIVIFVYIGAVEVCAHAVPFFRDVLDTKDPVFLGVKLAVLAAGIIIYAVLTFAAYIRSAKNFENTDM